MPFSSIHDFNADLVTLCGHKYHGPKGAGALFVRSPLHIEPLLVGGSHENERRAGTENLPAIVGFVEATSLFVPTPAFDAAILKPWTDRLLSALSDVPGVTLQCPAEGRLANTVAFSVEDADSTGLLAALDLAGICASSGSACAVGSLEPSHVLLAQGASPAAAASLVRLSLGRENTADELEFALRVIPDIVAQVRDVGISL
jgi:cysteine desulfurase